MFNYLNITKMKNYQIKKTLSYLKGELVEKEAVNNYLSVSEYREKKNIESLLKTSIFGQSKTSLQKRECRTIVSIQASIAQKRAKNRSLEQYARAIHLFYDPTLYLSADLRKIADKSELYLLRNCASLTQEEKTDFLRLMLLREIDKSVQPLDNDHSMALDLLLAD